MNENKIEKLFHSTYEIVYQFCLDEQIILLSAHINNIPAFPFLFSNALPLASSLL